MFSQLLFAYSYAKCHATLCTNVSNMISNLIFEDIKTYYNILNYKIGMFCRKIFLHVRMQKSELVQNYAQVNQTWSNIQYLRLLIRILSF